MEKTIVEKLKLTKYEKVAVLGKPEHGEYLSELEGYDTNLSDKYDLIFAFIQNGDELRSLVNNIIEGDYLHKSGYVYIAYPKKGNRVYPTYIHRDELFTLIEANEDGYVRESNIKYSRMVGLDDVFTVVGLKEDSKGKNKISSRASQCVDDYVGKIADIEKDLQAYPELLNFYQKLTPGYQKDWARFVYSAKQEVTRTKRKEEMKTILQAGYKSRDLYKRDRPAAL